MLMLGPKLTHVPSGRLASRIIITCRPGGGGYVWIKMGDFAQNDRSDGRCHQHSETLLATVACVVCVTSALQPGEETEVVLRD